MTKSRYVINIGLNNWQSDLVRAVKDAGYPVIGVDLNGQAPGVALVDEFINLSAYEPEPIARAIADLGISGDEIQAAITIGSRGCLTTAGALATKFNVPGPIFSASCLEILVDRAAFRKFLENNEFSTPTYRIVVSPEDQVNIAAPLIVKCVSDTSGSDGLTVVRDLAELPNAIVHAQNAILHQSIKRVVVEEYIEGHDVGVFGIFRDGKLMFSEFVMREVHAFPHCLPKRYFAPADLSAAERRLLMLDFERLAALLGAKTGPFYTEYRLDHDGKKCFALEGEPTLPAYAAKVISDVHGIDLNARFVDVVINNEYPRVRVGDRKHVICEFIYSSSTGRIKSMSKAAEFANTAEIYLNRKIGGLIDNHSAASICAAIFATAEDPQQTQSIIDSVVENFEIEMEA